MLPLKNYSGFVLAIFIGIQCSLIRAQDVVINEVMASNTATIADEDGDYPDWIELYNKGPDSINLSGWGLSDSEADLFRWILPAIELAPSQLILIFASDKDRKQWIPHWETVIDQGDPWKYFLGQSEPPADWNSTFFNDEDWITGKSGFGYGDGDDVTEVESVISIYIRTKFQIQDVQSVLKAVLHIDYDDAFVAYLNGIEFARSNIGHPGIPPPYNQGADNYDHEAQIYRGGLPERFDLFDWESLLQNGINVLAIQTHNHSITSSDLTCIPFFSLGLTQAPDSAQGTPEILFLESPGLHSNFKISADGESIFLTDKEGLLQDNLFVSNTPTDYSLGRSVNDIDQWLYFNQATPGFPNVTEGFPGLADDPQFSAPGGFYSSSLWLSLSSITLQGRIHYSLDGRDPDTLSAIYDQPILIDKTTVVRARVYGDGLLPSRSITHTYIIDNQSELPLISISTTPANLWDSENGIYVLGNDYEPNVPHYGANFWQDWERPAHVEMFENDGRLVFSIDAGIKIFGGWSRDRPQKSLSVFSRGRYGYPSIEYQLFPDRPFQEYTSFILRNAANDWDRTMFADGLIHNLAEPLDLENQAFRPCVFYLNGEYFGILNLREKINEEYLEMYHGVDPNNLDILENDRQVIEGDPEHYDQLLDFISTQDLSLTENYEYVKTQMDVDNFIDYQAFQIYIDNRDWPGNNIKYWRPKTESGRWRWILFDTEWGFGINAYGAARNAHAYDYNTLAYATSPVQTPNHHGNPPWSTFLLRSLLANEEFKNHFINRFADHINTIFKYETMSNEIDSLQGIIEEEMQRHYAKWHEPVWWSEDMLWWPDFSYWHNYIQILKDFAFYRSSYMLSHIIGKFNLKGTVWLNLNVSPQGSGQIQINSVMASEYPWKGIYFQNVPLQLNVKPSRGFRFKQWTGDINENAQEITIELKDNISINAEFESLHQLPSAVVINEINYHSADDFNPEDWIELYYEGGPGLDLSGWIIRDELNSHIFQIPAGTVMESGDFLVLCRDSSLFKNLFPTVPNFIGNLTFGLNGSTDMVRIYNAQDSLIDSVSYNDNSPWPAAADGQGATLELLNPGRDNALAENWAASNGHGSPGEENSVYTHIGDESINKLPQDFNLLQNYPNPFNPKTVIRYSLSGNCQVELGIYNILGQKVSTLVSAKQPAGKYKVKWDASGLSSGIYFYQLTTDQGFSQTRKLLLLK